jgi:hypothetical protein
LSEVSFLNWEVMRDNGRLDESVRKKPLPDDVAISPTKNNPVSQDIPVQHIQQARIFQYKIFSQQGYFSTKYSASKDIPVQIFSKQGCSSTNIQQARVFRYKIFSQQGRFSTKDRISKGGSVQNIQSAGMFQYKRSNEEGYSAQNIQPVGTLQHLRHRKSNPCAEDVALLPTPTGYEIFFFHCHHHRRRRCRQY